MKIREVRSLLARLKNIQIEMGAKSPAKDLDSIDALLDGHDNQDIDSFVEDTKAELAAKPIKASSKATLLNIEIVEQYSTRLLDENRLDGHFEMVFDDIRNCKDVRKAEAVAIAQKFLGTKMSFKTKKAALDKIHARYIQDRLYESKSETIKKMAI